MVNRRHKETQKNWLAAKKNVDFKKSLWHEHRDSLLTNLANLEIRERHNFTPKLSDSYISKREYGFDPVGTDFHYDDGVLDDAYYYPGARRSIDSYLEFKKINTRRHTKWHLDDIDGKYLQMCSEVNAESMMLRFLEKHYEE
ncbi:hypothetical protein L1987_54164 [Smallanthus sonchifolius]|uniref:Uncharacterized protein n=1 Tax=Smallanthus sonchifolius TaxID=185202 RepID=A0ACB9E6H0_9ASTR|nr:hypothetical protein L1987_54164 [Smallanthus sonchifolius]